MKDALSIFRFCLACMAGGERFVLVTLTNVEGSSSRGLGTHMAVSETGKSIGSLSGGCVEAAVVAQAREVLDAGRPASIRYGVGSPFIDIRLPCGGGIDLLFIPDPAREAIEVAVKGLAGRVPVWLRLGLDGAFHTSTQPLPARSADDFITRHDPDLQLLVLGHGSEPVAMAKLAMAHGAAVEVFSPDEVVLAAAGEAGAGTHLLTSLTTEAELRADRFTAIVFLFHDHDWETHLLAQALQGSAFFVGAMGSRQTHARRCAQLLANGMRDEDCARIVGPIGLIPASRDPQTLALSILAQVVAGYDEQRSAAGERQATLEDLGHL